MSLCGLCVAIPWESLPHVPPNVVIRISRLPYLLGFLGWPEDARGYEHHQSLRDLRKSAVESECGLCRLILKSAEAVQAELEVVQSEVEAGTSPQYSWPTWNLFIVKRKYGDGFCVMSPTDESKGEVRLVSAIGLCVRDDDPLHTVMPGRPVEESGETSIAISRARKWLDDCDCSPVGATLPSRVIDTGVDFHDSFVKLHETTGHEQETKYTTLSYCWGKSRYFSTTKATLEEKKCQITIQELPKTYRDAILLTRELGIRYLWIDSLCICQDDTDDWERESAKMSSIYSDAFLTIGADRAANSSEGFLGLRPSREYVEFEYICGSLRGTVMAFNLPLIEEARPAVLLAFGDEPLSKRAWAFQERVLPRRILHYGTEQMFFECNEGLRAEDGTISRLRYYSLGEKWANDTERSEGQLELSSRRTELLYSWNNLLCSYGPRKLTRPSDKLPAISGLAKIYAERIGDEYIAGLWRNSLVEGLVWRGFGCRRVSEYRAPSWSWASMDGMPGTDRRHRSDIIIADVEDIKVEKKGLNPFGEVIHGQIKIRAPLERLYWAIDNWDPTKPGLPDENNPKFRTANGSTDGVYSLFDFDYGAPDAPQEALKIVKSLEGVDLFALVMLKSHRREDDDYQCYTALIVRKVHGGEEMQRLGFIYLGEEDFREKPEALAKEDLSVVTLI
ncbi:hypothetical protein GJ744_001832 [Endocarpon pusillum]|uniref:Heterokaryon incompatibility domain-containing protein n=1 Tax=Endocarpon pusillum TaxID=364733 RepID=A0A8H7AQ40_9EURO|nr:hypothetical protein GJ744_001832 [Endocarpon pusillum]